MENKLNLPPFYVGQKVVCVYSIWLYVKGNTYIVKDVFSCSCGLHHVGCLPNDCPAVQLTCDCGKVHYGALPNGSGTVKSYRFAPVQEQSFPLMTFSQIKEKEKEEILLNN